MGWTIDWLYQLLLNRARDTWTEIVQAAGRRNERYPEYLAVTEHTDWNRQSTVTFGDPVRIWSSQDDFRSLCDASILRYEERPIDAAKLFFPVPVLSWYIAPDRKQVLICRHLGALYANGGWWDVVGQGRHGRLRASDRKSWIA